MAKGDNAARAQQQRWRDNKANLRTKYTELISAGGGRFHVSRGNVVANGLSRYRGRI